jgi:hypothetical protein
MTRSLTILFVASKQSLREVLTEVDDGTGMGPAAPGGRIDPRFHRRHRQHPLHWTRMFVHQALANHGVDRGYTTG